MAVQKFSTMYHFRKVYVCPGTVSEKQTEIQKVNTLFSNSAVLKTYQIIPASSNAVSEKKS